MKKEKNKVESLQKKANKMSCVFGAIKIALTLLSVVMFIVSLIYALKYGIAAMLG